MLASRMEKVFSGFKVNVYPCPDTPEERLNLLSRVEVRIVDLEEVSSNSISILRCCLGHETEKEYVIFVIIITISLLIMMTEIETDKL